jgi:chromosome segregation ATPase
MSQATIELLADSSQIKTATKDLNSLNAAGGSVEKSIDNTSDAVKRFTAEMTSTGRTVTSTNKVIGFLGKEIDSATSELRQLINESNKSNAVLASVESQLTKLSTASKNAADSASFFAETLSTVNQDLSFARTNIENFISDQIKLGRTIDANGNVISQSGQKLDLMTEDLKRLKAEYINTSNQSDELADSMNRVTLATDKNQAATQEAAATQSKLERELKDSQVAARAQARALGESSQAASKSSKGLTSISRNAGQAGIQVQQFTGQITTGTNGLVAFSQQAADLGIVLGAPLIGVFASLGATALLMASDTETAATSADKLEDSLETLSQTAELGANGLIEYTEEIRKLAEVSELAAAGRVEAAIKSANEAALNASLV